MNKTIAFKIQRRNLDAERESLEIQKEEEELRIAQEQVLEFKRVEQKAEIAKTREYKELRRKRGANI